MDNHENLQTEPLELEEQFFKAKAKFSSNAEAMQCMQKELESIASKYNYSIDELLEKAEASLIDNDDFNNVLSLDRRITFLKGNIQ